MSTHRTVGDVMTTEVITVHRNTAFKDIAALLAVHRISAVPVVDDSRHVLGVVSETDLLSKESAQDQPGWRPHGLGRRATLREKSTATRAYELMTAPAYTVRADAGLAVAARLVQRRDIKRLPVVDEHDRLVGVVSRRDLLRVFLRPDRDIAADISEQVLAGLAHPHWEPLSADVIDGVVILRGELWTRDAISEVVTRCRAVDGVVDVIDHLAVATGDGATRVPEDQ